MKLLLLVFASATWGLAAKIIDHWTHNFGLALLGGAVAALVVIFAMSCCRAAAMRLPSPYHED